ncbi:hypothetical protein [Gracilibacillus alcaliphilus]|uniref:hypothetical protein n=1 Tax=Gracilibacillus alcaliphilus TaxID=1401441 RepID=UPI001959DE7A|nr:hypothetical protein [Gracilibacillus alcaliphilus]MBM7678040.1 hypothetical protein [Gracilibacillus alcaliphilus]
MNKTYICDTTYFRSYLADCIVSFIEYKVNANRCKPESFLPVMSLFDRYCMDYPEQEHCLKRETVIGFLTIGPDEKIQLHPEKLLLYALLVITLHRYSEQKMFILYLL